MTVRIFDFVLHKSGTNLIKDIATFQTRSFHQKYLEKRNEENPEPTS